MKKTIIAAFLLSLPLFAFAQGQDELFPTGMEWREAFVEENFWPPDYTLAYDTLSFHDFEIGVDTIIGEKAYKKVVRDGKPYGCYIREADNCVWMKADVYPDEFKLYDFNWDGKESVTIQFLRWTDRYRTAVSVEDEKLDMKYKNTSSTAYKHTSTSEEVLSFYSNYTIVRGLGRVSELNRNSCLMGHTRLHEDMPDLVFSRVLWVKRNGTVVFTYPTGDTESIIPLSADQPQPAVPTYDLQGRRIGSSKFRVQSSQLRKGIYIRYGRKQIERWAVTE